MNRILLVEDHARMADLIGRTRAIGSRQRIINMRALGYALRKAPLDE